MLVVSTNVLAEHHESKTDEGQHFKKQRHKLLFSCRTSDKTWRQKCFKKNDSTFFNLFTFLLSLTLFKHVRHNLYKMSSSRSSTRRRTNNVLKTHPIQISLIDLSRFCASGVSHVLFYLPTKSVKPWRTWEENHSLSVERPGIEHKHWFVPTEICPQHRGSKC